MKNKILSILITVIASCVCAFALTACGGGGSSSEEPHVCTFKTTWSQSETHHWYDCESAECEEKNSYLEHVYDGSCDTICNTCNYTREVTHNYSQEWSQSETHHWHDCETSGCEEKGAYLEHVYDSSCDTTCNTCNYTREVTHNYSQEWSQSETHHWHECLTQGCSEKDSYIEHIFDDNCDTTCNTCEYVRTAPHSYSNGWEVDETYHWHECACGEKSEHSQHDFVKGMCVGCGYIQVTQGLSIYYYNDTYIVQGIGTAGNVENLRIPETYDDGTHGELDVTVIGNSAFYNLTSLKSVAISNKITKIDGSAFYNCASLTGVYITDITAWTNIEFETANSNPLYYAKELYLNGELVTNLELPNTVTNLNGFAFANCTSLTSVTIPASVNNIAGNAFYGCNNLETIDVASENTFYFSVDNCVVETASSTLILSAVNSTIPTDGSVTRIGNYAFDGRLDLKTITIPSAITAIGDYAFKDCINLTSIVVPETVTELGIGVFLDCVGLLDASVLSSSAVLNRSFFSGCINMQSLTIPFVGESSAQRYNRVYLGWIFGAIEYTQNKNYVPTTLTNVVVTSATSIANYAFYECENITSVTILNAGSIGNYAFYNCFKLENVVLPNEMSNIGSHAFYDTAIKSIKIPNGITTINENTFYSCNALEEVSIPASLTTINDHAFYDCGAFSKVNITSVEDWCKLTYNGDYSAVLYYAHNLYLNGELVTSITLPSTLNSMNRMAFAGCTNLESVTIPSTITTISVHAFSGCKNLTDVVFQGEITTIETGAFYGCEKLANFDIPSTVTSIGASAFERCKSLTYITIPNSITSISKSAFYGANITGIVIPKSVTAVEQNAFQNAVIGSIYYYGTIAEWQKVSIASGNTNLKITPVYVYSENEPLSSPRSYWHYVNGVPTLWE